MSVIIRLQGLPWSASAMDIRQYFQGLSIPDGGVHIVGGDRGDAFIAFGSDEDARQAMLRTNGQINGNTVQLLLSSKTEMQNVIALARESVPAQAFTKPAPTVPPPTGPPTGPPTSLNDHLHALTPQNHATFDSRVPPPRNIDYSNRRDFQTGPTDISTAPPTTSSVTGLPALAGLRPDTKFPPSLLNPSNINRDPYFVQPEQDNSNRQPRQPDFRPSDVSNNFPINRRPNFPPTQDLRLDSGPNDQRHFGAPNISGPVGFLNMRDGRLNLPNFQIPPNPRNLPMPNTAIQPPELVTPGKPPVPDVLNPYNTECRENDNFDTNRGNMRPNVGVRHMPPPDINRPDQNRLDFSRHGPPRAEPLRHDAGPPIGRGDMMNRPDQSRVNDPTRPDSNKLDASHHMNFVRNELGRPDNRGQEPSRLDTGRHEPHGMGRPEPNRPEIGRREPAKLEAGRHDPSRTDAGRNYPNRSDGGRHESRFDSSRLEANRTEHVRTDQERTESLRLETGRMSANRSDTSRPGGSARPDLSKSDQNRPESGRNEPTKSESGRHESNRNDSSRSDSGRHDSKSDSRHDSRSESGRYDSSRYDSGRHDSSRHERSRDDGSRYDRRGRDDTGSRYDRRDNRRDSRYDSHYEGSGRHDNRYESGRYDESSSRYETSRNDTSRHDGGRGSDKTNREGTGGSRDFDRAGRDNQPKQLDPTGPNRNTTGQGGVTTEPYKNAGLGNVPPRQGDANSGRKGPIDRGDRPKGNVNEYGGDGRRDYNYGQPTPTPTPPPPPPPPPPQHDQGFPVSGLQFDGQRFEDRPLVPPYGTPGMNEDPSMFEAKQKMYDETDMSGLPRGLLGDAPPGFLPGQSGPPLEGQSTWDEGYGIRDDRMHVDHGPEDYHNEWHDEDLNMRTPFNPPGSWNDMPPNQPPYQRNDGPSPFPRNEPYGRYDGPNRNERGPPPGRMPGGLMDDRPYGPPNEMGYGPGPEPGNRRPGSIDENAMRGMKRGHREPDLYVEVVGLPFTVGYRDVRRFFSGCTIPRDGLKLINNEKGRRAGNAFIKFASEMDTCEAFTRHGNFMGNRYIEIYSCAKEDFDNAVDSFVPKTTHGGPPPNKTMKIDSGNETSSKDTSINEAPPQAKPSKETGSSSANSSAASSSGNIVQIKGIPLNATNDDIIKFLKDVHVTDASTCIVIEHDSRGKNTGIAYIEVATKKDYDAALGYDGRHMGGRLIRIVEGTKKDMSLLQEKEKKGVSDKTSPNKNQKDASKPVGKTESKTSVNETAGSKASDAKSQDKKPVSGASVKKNEPVTTRPAPYYCVSLKGLPFAVTTNEIKDFFQGLNIAPRGIQIVYGKDGRTTGQAFVEFVTSTDCETALTRDKKYIGKRYVNVHAVTKAEMMDHLKQARQANLQNNIPDTPPTSHFMVHSGGKQYEFLKGENFPPTVSIGEILNFFRGYYPVPESIRLHYSEAGRPTGNAMIGFLAREEAIKAMEDLNCKNCRKNVVTLHMA